MEPAESALQSGMVASSWQPQLRSVQAHVLLELDYTACDTRVVLRLLQYHAEHMSRLQCMPCGLSVATLLPTTHTAM